MITLSNKSLEERFERLWRELQKIKSEGQSLTKDELDEECIIFLEGRIIQLAVINKSDKNAYFNSNIDLTFEDMDAIDETFPPPEHTLGTRPCPVCKNPDACDSYCPTCDA